MPIKIEKRNRPTDAYVSDLDGIRKLLSGSADRVIVYSDSPEEEPWGAVINYEMLNSLILLAEAAAAAQETVSGQETITLRSRVQEQQNKINALKDTIMALKDEVAELRGVNPPSERMWRTANSLADALRPQRDKPWQAR